MTYEQHDRLKIIGGVLLIAALIAWVVAEFAVTKSFVGALVSKGISVSYSRDYEDDETTATKRYELTFYVDGNMKTVLVEKQRATRIGWSEAAALQKLEANNSEPAEFTHAKVQRQYVVKTRGWIIDDTVIEITDLATIKAE
jgi:hypothetical protein